MQSGAQVHGPRHSIMQSAHGRILAASRSFVAPPGIATHLSVAMRRSRRSQAACARRRRVTRGYGPAKLRQCAVRPRARAGGITISMIIWPEPPSPSSGHLPGWNRQLATQGAGADARGSVNAAAQRGTSGREIVATR